MPRKDAVSKKKKQGRRVKQESHPEADEEQYDDVALSEPEQEEYHEVPVEDAHEDDNADVPSDDDGREDEQGEEEQPAAEDMATESMTYTQADMQILPASLMHSGGDNSPAHQPAAHTSARTSGRPSQAVVERLVIRDIDVENFKSYFGRHRIGPFHKTFTSVIGPNGSGKSNVIDSMLFVFGRNAKKIRLEKLSEVIHNSAAHPHVTYASVTVNFIKVRETPADEKNPEQRFEIPGSELSIKREVFKSGASQYFIDGTRRSQKEVMDTLIQQGVDLEHNRFLILQGEVEQIALMKPKAEKDGEEGLLEYLDDLIGTNEFIGRITDVTAHAEQAQLARLDALDKERRLKQEREALDSAKNSTVAFVTKDNHLQKTLIVMCQLRMRNIEDKLVEPRRLLEEVDQRIDALEEDVKARREAKSAAEEAAAKAKKDVAERTKARDGVRGARQAAEGKLEKLRSGADEQERARKKVQDQLTKCEDDLAKAATQQQDADREAVIHQENLDEATNAADALQKAHDAMAEQLLPTLRPLRQALEEKRKAFAPYDHAVAEANEQVSAVQDRLQTQEKNHSKRVAEHEHLTATVERQAARLLELEEMLRKADRQDRREELIKAQDALAEATRRKYSVDRSIQEIKSQYREGEADDRAAEFLLSQRTLKGYYGTLRQLGRIDDAMDVAAGVASNAWGFHVVEDRATAAAALELLKTNNIGRATMMIISEVEKEMGPRMARPFKAPNPKAQRLFDLIKPTNAKFRGVFYQAVRDTLVVQTLAEARETAFGSGDSNRHRVVTMKGELVEPNGTITGGGAAPRGAKLKAARSPQDKQAIKEELQRLQQSLVHVAEEERGLQQQLHQLQESEASFSPEQLRRLRAESGRLSAQLDGDRQRLEQLTDDVTQSSQALAERTATLEADLESCRSRLAAAETNRARHHTDLAALEQQVEDAGGAAFKDVTDKLKTEQDRIEAEENALRTCRRQVQKLRATQERRTADLERFQRDLRAIDEEAEEGAKEEVRACAAELAELTEQLTALEAALAEAQTSCDEKRAAVPVANSAALEAQKKLDDEQRYKQTEQAKIADALQELAKFEQKIDGCEAKIKENAELYGIETLQLEGVNGGGDAAAGRNGNDDQDDEDDDEEDDDEEDDDDDDQDDDEESGKDGRRHHAGRKRGRGSGRIHRRRDVSREELANMSFKLSPDELQSCDYDRSVHLAKALSEETKRLHGEIDFRAVALWRERDLAHREAKADYEDKKLIADKAEKQLIELKEKRRTAFMSVFERIRRKLKEVYQLLTHGGDADMELVDVNDPFEGINFVVRPPKKSWKQISNLSGGEKTLSSLALIFSLHHIKPTPIYVMDEIDAALDFRNVSIVANYVLRQATGAQFIIISLRNNMFELAHQLVGVCKVNDITRTLVLMPRSFQRVIEHALVAENAKRRRSTTEADDEAASSLTPVVQCARKEETQEGTAPASPEQSASTPTEVAQGRASKKSVRFSDELRHDESDSLPPRASQLSMSS